MTAPASLRPFAHPRAMALAAAVLLVVAGVAIMLANGEAYRRQQLAQIGVQADVLAEGVSAALAFDDEETLREYVVALSANPELLSAGVYDETGALVAGYARDTEPPPASAAEARSSRRSGAAQVWREVSREGSSPLGGVYLSVAADSFLTRMMRYGVMALFTGFAALVIAVLSAWSAYTARTNEELSRRAARLAEANERLEREIEQRERAERALAQSQKMEAIGQLTGGLAHDFNNLLAAVTSGLRLLGKSDDPERRAAVETAMQEALGKGARLTRQLLMFARGQSAQSEVIDPAARIDAMQELLSRSLREDIVVETDFEDGLWSVRVDPDQLELVILNLAVNARDAMPNGGRLRIGARNVERGDDPKGDFVRLFVHDTGVGMSPDMIDRAFEPFFTTKEIGKGTGLGLPQVYGFARQSGGVAWIESRPGEGATVFVDLPRAARSDRPKRTTAARAETPAQERAAPAELRFVLLVEDDPAVGAMVCQLIETFGFDCSRAASAPEALDLLAQRQFDVVLSDIVMPGGMNGVELAREIGRRHPELPVILTTGYSGEAHFAPGEFKLLPKPCDPDVLYSALCDAVAATEMADDRA